MPVNPRSPVSGPINFDYRHGDDFAEPPHMIRSTRPIVVDPALTPLHNIDTSYDRSAILGMEPLPKVRPIFLGLRRALADRKIRQSNEKLHELRQQHHVAHVVGDAILNNRLYTEEEIGGQPNMYRPATPQEIKAARELDKIGTRRRRVGSHAHSVSRNLTSPVRATKAERRHESESTVKYGRAHAKLDKLDNRFRRVIEKPLRQADRVIAKRNRAVAKHEAINHAVARRDARRQQRIEKLREMRDEVMVSAQALSDEIIERHYDSWDLTKEQAIRVGTVAVKIGHMATQETVATSQTAVKGGKYTARFYADVARGAADIYWQAAKRAGHGTVKGTRKLYRAARSKK